MFIMYCLCIVMFEGVSLRINWELIIINIKKYGMNKGLKSRAVAYYKKIHCKYLRK